MVLGGVVKRLFLFGVKEGEFENVYILCGVGDVSKVLSVVGEKKDKEVVIIGISFIGMEIVIVF